MSGPGRGRIVALYSRLIAHFRERILDGSLPSGSLLPGELELAEIHSVSRGTVRQAMTALVNEGLVERIQGRGCTSGICPEPRRDEQKGVVSS